MSNPQRDDLSNRITAALSSNPGVTWDGCVARRNYRLEAEVVWHIIEPELKRLSDDRDHWETEAGNWRQEVEELHAYAARIERERDEHRKAADEAEAKLRKQEHGCETPESHTYGCPCDGEPIEFRGGSITLAEDPVTAEIRFDAGPWSSTTAFIEETEPEEINYNERTFARVRRTVGVRIDGRVWMEFLRAASTVDPGSKALREELADLREKYEKARADAEHYKAACEFKPISIEMNGPLWPWLSTHADVDDLKATIVSQAREIARLKGESA